MSHMSQGCLGYTGWSSQLLILLTFWAWLEGWLRTLRMISFIVPFVASPSAPVWLFLSVRHQHTSPVSFITLIAVLLPEDNDISKTKGQLRQHQLTVSAVMLSATTHQEQIKEVLWAMELTIEGHHGIGCMVAWAGVSKATTRELQPFFACPWLQIWASLHWEDVFIE